MERTVVEAFIEIPKGSQNKFEFDQEQGVFRLDRVLYGAVHYPGEYGYIPQTLAEDGDQMDILVLISNPTFPGCLIEARVVGALEMVDEQGRDLKILSVAERDPRFEEMENLGDVPAHIKKEIKNFFTIYKDLEGKGVQVNGWRDLEYARRAIEESRHAYRSANP